MLADLKCLPNLFETCGARPTQSTLTGSAINMLRGHAASLQETLSQKIWTITALTGDASQTCLYGDVEVALHADLCQQSRVWWLRS